MLIQIIIMNALPLFNMELAFTGDLKEIGKSLKHFD
jgi:hypothetical protein